MPEDIIKARIVFDKKGLAGATDLKGGKGGLGSGLAEAFSKTAFAQDFPVWGDILAGVGGLVLALRALHDMVRSFFQRLIKASPHLQATMELISKTLNVTLRPIADTFSALIRPFVVSWLRFVLPIYKSWRKWFSEGGGAEARVEIGEGFKEIWDGIINWDFKQVWNGVKQVFSGIGDLFRSFGEEVMGEQFKKAEDWWDGMKEKFGTEGVWDTLWEMFKSAALDTINWFGKELGLIGEGEDFSSISDAIKSAIKVIPTTLLDFIKNITPDEWKSSFMNMAEGMRAVIEAKMPGLLALIEYVGEKLEEQKEKSNEIQANLESGLLPSGELQGGTIQTEEWQGRLKDVIETQQKAQTKMDNTDNSGFVEALQGIWSKTLEVFGTKKGDKGLIPSLKDTQDEFSNSKTKAEELKGALDLIPKSITTVHTIITRRVEQGVSSAFDY